MDYARLLFSFKGRINRARYLVVQLALFTFWLTSIKYQFHFPAPWEAFDLVVAVMMIWISTATTAKRLHDRNRSGWWAVAIFLLNRLSYAYCGLFFGLSFGVDISIAEQLLLVMLIAGLSLLQTGIIIDLFFLIGTDGPNRFGSDPTRSAADFLIDSRPERDGVPDFLVRRAGPAPT